jgi:hypothetical protein
MSKSCSSITGLEFELTIEITVSASLELENNISSDTPFLLAFPDVETPEE